MVILPSHFILSSAWKTAEGLSSVHMNIVSLSLASTKSCLSVLLFGQLASDEAAVEDSWFKG